MGILNVVEYRVGTNRSRGNPNAHRFFLSLTGFSEAGPARRAIVYFWPTPPADTVGYLAGDLVVGLLPIGDFAPWYDLLRHEKPVKVNYVESGTPSDPRFYHLSLGTSDEGVGEGPRDPDA